MAMYNDMYINMDISLWVYFLTGLILVLLQTSTAVLAKTKADIAKKSSYCYSSCWVDPHISAQIPTLESWINVALQLLIFRFASIGQFMSLQEKSRDQINPSGLFMAINFYQSNLLVLFMVLYKVLPVNVIGKNL